MLHHRVWSLLLALTVAWADPAVTTERAGSGPLKQRLVEPDGADLVLLYVGEHAGTLGTCGCAHRPRGGLARLQSYSDAVRRAQPDTPTLLLHAGQWASDRIDADGTLRPDARIANQAMLEGLALAGVDAANLTWKDAPTFAHAPRPDWVVSSSLGPAGAASARLLDAGDRRVAVLGATPFEADWLQPDGWSGGDPVDGVRHALTSLPADVDLVVVLTWGTRAQTQDLAELPGVDVVVEASEFVGRDTPWTDTDTVWVRSRSQGQSVGELRLWLDGEGRITRAVDRWVDLDDRLPEHRRQRRLARRTERARERWLREALEMG